MPHEGPLRGAAGCDQKGGDAQGEPERRRGTKSTTRRRALAVGLGLGALALVAQLAAGHLAGPGREQPANSSSIEQQQQQQQPNQRPLTSSTTTKQHQQATDRLLFNHHQRAMNPAQVVAAGTCAGKLKPLDHPEQPASLSSSLLRVFIRTNNMRAYHLDLHSYREGAKFIGDPAFVDSREASHVQRCRRHLNHYEALLRTFRQTGPMDTSSPLDSLRLADTFGRPDAGLLEGHQFWLGSYEGCLELRNLKLGSQASGGGGGDLGLETAKPETVNSQYCLGLAQFPSWNPKDTKTSIKIGMCMPETCTSSMLNEHEDLLAQSERMMKYNLGEGLPFNKLRLRSVYCLPHDTSQVRQYTLSSKLFIGVMSCFVLACLYASLSDYLNKKTVATPSIKLVRAAEVRDGPSAAAAPQQAELSAEQGAAAKQQLKLVMAADERTWRNVFVESFSLFRNFEKLTTIRGAEQSTNQTGEQMAQTFDRDLFFRCITGIKCIGLLWIIAAHCFLVGPITGKNLIGLDKLTKTYLANVYLTAHLLVDTFFALSGLLASYLIFRGGIHKLQMSHWVIMTVHRYWRLTPVYLICYWFAKSMGHLNNSGPLWDYQTAEQSPRLNCVNESWLEAILHQSDFKSPKSHCVPFAWFIANGIKFWIVTPLFLVAIYKSVRRGYALVGAAILANIAIVFSLAINSPVDMKSVIEFKPESADNMLNDMEDIYTRPYSRIGAYLVGLLAGHWFYTLEKQQQGVNLSEKTKILVWSLVSITMIVLAFVVKIAGGIELEESAIPWVFSFCSAIIRPLWALCTCWLVFALSHGQARWLARFVGAPSWSLIAKVSFSAYLVQGEVIANLYLASAHSSPYTYADMVQRPIVAAAGTIGAAFLMALFVEYPLIGIEELILPAKRPSAEAAHKSSANSTVEHQTAKVIEAHVGGKPTGDVHSTSVSTIENGNKLKEL